MFKLISVSYINYFKFKKKKLPKRENFNETILTSLYDIKLNW